MRLRLEAKGAAADRLVVIPNWVDTQALTPQPRNNPWAREHGFTDRFVVMHSGNVGHAQNLDALIRAGTFLRDLEDLRIAIIGGGARRDELKALARLLEVDQVRFLGYQPRELLPFSLSSADVHVVGLARGLAGLVVPSRLYGILAVARPVIAAVEEESETAAVVRAAGCGLVVAPGDAEGLAAAIREARGLDLDELGRRGRDWVVANADRRAAIERYRALLAEVRSADGPTVSG
jgi:glycosyltransferase involved in cell wall biosynthesis